MVWNSKLLPPFRPHPPTQPATAGHTPTAGWEAVSTLPPLHKLITYRCFRKGGVREWSIGWGCREGRLKEGGVDSQKGESCGQVEACEDGEEVKEKERVGEGERK